MKTTKLSMILPSLILITGFSLDSSAAEVKVEFSDAKKFSDYELSGQNRKKSLEVLEKDMQSLFTDLSKEVISDDHQLSVKVKNIDLPGIIRYGMGQTNQDIRVIDNTTFFRLEFDYTLKNAAGETVKQGEHELKEFTDSQSESLHMRNRGTLAYFEKPLKKWMKATLVE